MLKACAVVATLILSTGASFASSDDAWAEFDAEVQVACLDATATIIKDPVIVVDPYGSESLGLAVVSGPAIGGDAKISIICTFNKATKAVEIGGEFDSAVLQVTPPAE